jgi:general secretion pathway protein I
MNSLIRCGGPRAGARTPPSRKGQGGFSLIEVLVAFSIMALVLGVLFQIFSTGLRTAGMAEQYSVAERLAHSLLDEASAMRPLEVGERSGEFDGTRYRWRTRIEPEPDLGPDFASPRFSAYRITVRVMWEGRGGDRDFRLSTLRLQEDAR